MLVGRVTAAHACRAAKPQGLHFEEDSKRLGMLSKYDDEESEALVEVGRDGTLDDADVRASIAARLRASAGTLPHGAGGGAAAAAAAAAVTPPDAAREYMHASEAGMLSRSIGDVPSAARSSTIGCGSTSQLFATARCIHLSDHVGYRWLPREAWQKAQSWQSQEGQIRRRRRGRGCCRDDRSRGGQGQGERERF